MNLIWAWLNIWNKMWENQKYTIYARTWTLAEKHFGFWEGNIKTASKQM